MQYSQGPPCRRLLFCPWEIVVIIRLIRHSLDLMQENFHENHENAAVEGAGPAAGRHPVLNDRHTESQEMHMLTNWISGGLFVNFKLID